MLIYIKGGVISSTVPEKMVVVYKLDLLKMT